MPLRANVAQIYYISTSRPSRVRHSSILASETPRNCPRSEPDNFGCVMPGSSGCDALVRFLLEAMRQIDSMLNRTYKPSAFRQANSESDDCSRHEPEGQFSPNRLFTFVGQGILHDSAPLSITRFACIKFTPCFSNASNCSIGSGLLNRYPW